VTAVERPDLRLLPPALSAELVAWQGYRLGATALLASAALLGAVAGVLVARPGAGRAAAAAVCACTAGIAAVTGLHLAARASGPVPGLAREQASVAVVATVLDDPRTVAPRPGTRPGPPLVVVRLRVEELEARGRVHRLSEDVVLLSSDRHWLSLLPSQRVRSEGRLRAAQPGDDVAAVVSGRGPPRVLSGPSRVQRVAGSLRQGLRDAVRPLPADERGLLPGLVVGDVSRLDPALSDDFRAVGLTHLVAVSGTNCSIVAGAVLLLAARLRLGLRARPALAGLALVGFAVLARPSPSVLRASVMGAVGLLALATGTRRAALPALCGAVLVLLALSPELAGSAGFALSVLATGGLLLLAGPWTAALARVLPGRTPTWVAGAVAVPAAAQAVCGPVIVALSAQLGLLSVPANLLAAPAVAPATVAGVLAALLAPVCLPAAQAVAWVGYLPSAWMVAVARTGAHLPGATLPWPGGTRGALLLSAASLAALLLLPSVRVRRTLLAGSTGAAVALTGVGALAPAWPPAGWFMVTCDVGQGDAHVLAVGPSTAVVVDAGPDPAGVDGCLRRLHVTRIPVVVLTHLHADHVDGLPGVLRGRQVGLALTGPLEDPPEQHRAVVAQLAAAHVPLTEPGLGEVREVGPLRWQVLAPARVYRGTRSDPNNSSLVLRVEVGGTRVLLTGDVEPEAQRDLLDRGVDLSADVLKVPHHGSDHQEPAFLDAVGAAVTLTSVGRDNSYGHPSAATLGRLMGDGARSFRTDEDGDIALVHREGRLLVVARRGRGTVAPAAPTALVGPWTP
jgi:competence protein ComEC